MADEFEKMAIEIATEIFGRHGLDFSNAERAGGWTNAVWLNGDTVLRLSSDKGGDRIRREAGRAKYLPPVVGYPQIIETGVTGGYEWSLSKRIDGVVLSDVWGGLSWRQKSTAIRQIMKISDGVHSVDVGKVEDITLRRSWYDAFDRDESISRIERYTAEKIFTAEQGGNLRDILDNFFQWLATVTPVLNHGDIPTDNLRQVLSHDDMCTKKSVAVLNHGDITTDNLFWNDGGVSALLDFEHAVIAPPLLDLHSIINIALIEGEDEKILVNENDPEIRGFVGDMQEFFRPMLRRQSDRELLLGYSVLFRMRFLGFWLENPESDDIGQSEAWKKLVSLSDGNGGYFRNLLT